MKANTTMSSETGETSGTKFFTWAIIVVAAGLLVAVTTDFTTDRNMTAATHSAAQTQSAKS